MLAGLRRDGHSLGEAEALKDELVLAPGEQRRIEVRVPGTGKVTGRVLDPQGTGLAGVTIQVRRMDSELEHAPLFPYLQETLIAVERLSPAATEQASLPTDSAGRFELAALPIGIYHVGAAPGADVPALGKLLVVRDEETSAIELVLERALWIRGRVLDPRGAPVRGLELVGAGQEEGNGMTLLNTTTEDDGSFALGPLLPGRYEVRVGRVEDEHSAPCEPLVVEAGTEGLALALVLGGTLAIELENGLEDERLDVRVRREGATETSGWLYSLAPGRYEVLAVSDEGRFAFERGVVITGGRDHTLTLTLAPGATVTLPEDPGAIDSFELSVDGFALGTLWPHREHTVPPGHVRVEGQAWSARARLETVLVRERDLAPGEAWIVDLAH